MLRGGHRETKIPCHCRMCKCICAYAKDHSIASALGIGGSILGDALFGNTVASVADIFLSVFGDKSPDLNDAIGVLSSGATQGLSTSNSPGPVGPAGLLGNFIQTVVAERLVTVAPSFSTVGAQALSNALGVAKLTYDASQFLSGYYLCSR